MTEAAGGTDVADGRSAVLVLVTPDGALLGASEPLTGLGPSWSSAADLVDAARERLGLAVTVLRLLRVEHGPAGAVRTVHAAQVDAVVGGPGAVGVPGAVVGGPVAPDLVADLRDHPQRLPFARPGGPAADLAWADGALEALGTPRTGPARQVRTWNLSSIWTLPTARGPAWLKAVPPFFAHEGAVLALVGEVSDGVPPLLAHEPGRVLLGDVPGEDLYRAPADTLARMVPLLVEAQAALAGRTADLLATGCFDWRAPRLGELAADAAARHGGELDADARAGVELLLDGLPDRLAAVAACGGPVTLVHGDFHPGNVRGPADGAAGPLAILDWGDAGVGDPLLDQAAFLEWVPLPERGRIADLWSDAWRRAVPGCEPDRASRLLAPVAALRQAVIYRVFLDRIEPTERVYHARDPAVWLTRAAELARRETTGP